MNIKLISNASVATAIKDAFNYAFYAKTSDQVKVSVTGTGTVRSAVVRNGDDHFSANVTVSAEGVISALLQGAAISLNEWSRLSKKASSAAMKAHDKVVSDFVDTRKKADKKADEVKRKSEKKAAQALVQKTKAAAKKVKDAAKSKKVKTGGKKAKPQAQFSGY